MADFTAVNPEWKTEAAKKGLTQWLHSAKYSSKDQQYTLDNQTKAAVATVTVELDAEVLAQLYGFVDSKEATRGCCSMPESRRPREADQLGVFQNVKKRRKKSRATNHIEENLQRTFNELAKSVNAVTSTVDRGRLRDAPALKRDINQNFSALGRTLETNKQLSSIIVPDDKANIDPSEVEKSRDVNQSLPTPPETDVEREISNALSPDDPHYIDLASPFESDTAEPPARVVDTTPCTDHTFAFNQPCGTVADLRSSHSGESLKPTVTHDGQRRTFPEAYHFPKPRPQPIERSDSLNPSPLKFGPEIGYYQGLNSHRTSQPKDNAADSDPSLSLSDTVDTTVIDTLKFGGLNSCKLLFNFKWRMISPGIQRLIPAESLPSVRPSNLSSEPIEAPATNKNIPTYTTDGDFSEADAPSNQSSTQSALSTAAKVVEGRIIRRNMQSFDRDKVRKGTSARLSGRCDGSGKQKNVSFDDYEARVVLAGWKGLDPEDVRRSGCEQSTYA